jgi:hypothetical protein
MSRFSAQLNIYLSVLFLHMTSVQLCLEALMNGYTLAGTLDRQPDLLARLQNVVRQLNRSDIRTVSALISKVIGDQNAGLMAVQLLHWFPKSKKIGGWVYKSWRDWNAECNLSQGQVKRVHGSGFLEMIGIERTIMKANGTPTVHYRLDQSKLIQKITQFLGVIQAQILSWMGLEITNEVGENRPTNEADLDPLNKLNQPDEIDENEPFHSANNAQSITDSHLQNKLHHNLQDRQQNRSSAVVVDADKEKKKEMFQSLGKLGISYFKATQLIEKCGYDRINEAIRYSKEQKLKSPAGYIIRALEENWIFTTKSPQNDYACGDGTAYITGKYSAFIKH